MGLWTHSYSRSVVFSSQSTTYCSELFVLALLLRWRIYSSFNNLKMKQWTMRHLCAFRRAAVHPPPVRVPGTKRANAKSAALFVRLPVKQAPPDDETV